MAAQQQRSFEDKPATREQVPLMIGIMGPSGGGKTFSALRLATGIQRVSGGDIYMIDTEAKRGLHYAEQFKFRHLAFGAPFSPLDYLGAVEHCVKRGAKIIIVDSMSHEHEGPGGVLEMHDTELQRISGGDARKADRVNMLAWARPKADRRRMINTVLQMQCHFIFCFRAKEKLRIEKGKEPTPMGFMPIAGEEFVYEMAVNVLLMPNAGGVPTWRSDSVGERQMIKQPEQFRQLFGPEVPLSEDIGTALAQWAKGAPIAGDTSKGAPEQQHGNGSPIKTEIKTLIGELDGLTERGMGAKVFAQITGQNTMTGLAQERLEEVAAALRSEIGVARPPTDDPADDQLSAG